ncbi:MAG TPA: chemotaxis protein CheW [Candidatus Angelobacter sp.]|jgi:purine-binding chemotaxis protein CheW|nr:chemotaxis protein CheW [Candidatus Angelobacter sp.]
MDTAIKEAIEQQQYLTFVLANEECAISILKVREIIEHETITTVPRMAPWMQGVINLRGSVVPVVALAAKFGMEQRPVGKTTCIVIVEAQFEDQQTTVGLIVDAVSQVMELADDDIQPVPDFGTSVKMDYLIGMAQSGRKFALLLDVDKVLTTEELHDLSVVASSMKSPGTDEFTGEEPPMSNSMEIG